MCDFNDNRPRPTTISPPPPPPPAPTQPDRPEQLSPRRQATGSKARGITSLRQDLTIRPPSAVKGNGLNIAV